MPTREELDSPKRHKKRTQSGKTIAQILIKKRWVITIQMEHQSEDALDEWLKLIAVNKLTQIKDGPLVKRPESFTAVSINELSGKAVEVITWQGAELETDELTTEPFLEDDQAEEE